MPENYGMSSQFKREIIKEWVLNIYRYPIKGILKYLQVLFVLLLSSYSLASTLSGSSSGAKVTININCTGVYCELYRTNNENIILTRPSNGSTAFSENLPIGTYSYFLFTYVLSNYGPPIHSGTIAKTISVINQAPSISSISSRTINEDGNTGNISFTVSDIETSANQLKLRATSSNSSLVPNSSSSIVFGGGGGNRTIRVYPSSNKFGAAKIVVYVTDGNNKESSTSFNLTVRSVNDTPTISNISNKAISEDGHSGDFEITVTDVETSNGSLTVTGSSNNTGLVTNGNINISAGSSASKRKIRITPTANKYGSATISLKVSDSNGGNRIDTFLLTVNSIDDPPTISPIGSITIPEGGSTGDIEFSVTDVDTAVSALSISASSSNELVQNGDLVLGGSGTDRTIRVTPVAGEYGSTTITLAVSDGVSSVTETFVLAVNQVSKLSGSAIGTKVSIDIYCAGAYCNLIRDDNENTVLLRIGNGDRIFKETLSIGRYRYFLETYTATGHSEPIYTGTHMTTVDVVNTAPTISAIDTIKINEGENTGNISFTVFDVETDASQLKVRTQSSNAALVPNSEINIALSGSGENREIKIIPVAGGYGIVDITIFVTDGEKESSTDFTVIVNSKPDIVPVGDMFIPFGATLPAFQITVSDVETNASKLNVTAVSSNAELLTDGGVSISSGSSSDTRKIQITPIAGQSGMTQVSLTVSDGSATNSEIFYFGVRTDPSTRRVIFIHADQLGSPAAETDFFGGSNE